MILETKTSSNIAISPVITLYTWDNNGNMTSKAIGSLVTYYAWNSDNWLIAVKQGTTEATAVTIAKYWYDVKGNRVMKVEPGQGGLTAQVTSYLIDSTFPYAQVVQETSTQGLTTVSTRYVWGNRARWYAPNVGRFVSMDTFKGQASIPSTLNKYLYASSDPVNSTDPSGLFTLTQLNTTIAISSTLLLISQPSFQHQLSTIASTLIRAMGSRAVQAESPIFTENALKKSREKLEADVTALAARKGKRNVLFHYTSEVAVTLIFADQCITASAGYNHPDGIYRRSGAYATPLPPWFPNGTIKDLRALLYAKGGSRDLSAFVAIAGDNGWGPATGGNKPSLEYVKPGYPGSCVPVDAFIIGPNMWGDPPTN